MANRLINQLTGKEVAGWKNASGSPLVKMTNLNTGKYIEFEQPVDDRLCFTAEEAGSTIALNKSGPPADISLVVSTDGTNWEDYTIGSIITLANIGDKVFMRAKTENETISSSLSNYYQFIMSGKIFASGNIQYLLDSTGQRLDVPVFCYCLMFGNCTGLTTAPELPATILADYCYEFMFYNCPGLTIPPELPATELAMACYDNMFSGCTSLTSPPELPATTLASGCYHYMFKGCTGLESAPELPATTLASDCYYGMFQGCTGLTTAPELPATILAKNCYLYMFRYCNGIKLSTIQTDEYQTPYRIPKEGTGTTASSALTNMFANTGGTFTGTPEINTTYYGAW